MVDVVTPDVRSRMMAGIRSGNTKPELVLRSGLHRLGFRFKLHQRNLPGRPDIVFPKYHAVIFVHGCFWHGHSCHLFKWPSTRPEFWKKKITGNQKVDARAISKLAEEGWRVGTVWECALKGRTRISADQIVEECARWLRSKRSTMGIKGRSL